MKKYTNFDMIIYDYTGYASRQCLRQNIGEFDPLSHEMTDLSISSDLEEVFKWSKLRQEQVILWGFSLGCHPSIRLASQLPRLNLLIAQSPFTSVYGILSDVENSLFGRKQGVTNQKNQFLPLFSETVNQECLHTFDGDYFDNLTLIGKVKSEIVLFHSTADEIIPHSHSEILTQKFYHENKGAKKMTNKIEFIEVDKIGHNDMFQVFVSRKANALQKYLREFLQQSQSRLSKINQKQQKEPLFLNPENNLQKLVQNRDKTLYAHKNQANRAQNLVPQKLPLTERTRDSGIAFKKQTSSKSDFNFIWSARSSSCKKLKDHRSRNQKRALKQKFQGQHKTQTERKPRCPQFTTQQNNNDQNLGLKGKKILQQPKESMKGQFSNEQTQILLIEQEQPIESEAQLNDFVQSTGNQTFFKKGSWKENYFNKQLMSLNQSPSISRS